MEYFPELTRIVSVTAITQGTYVKGEWVPGTTEPQADIRMVVMPLTPRSLKNLPEGKYPPGIKSFITSRWMSSGRGLSLFLAATGTKLKRSPTGALRADLCCIWAKG